MPTPKRPPVLGLVGDIGGTNCRLALVEHAATGPRLAAHRSFLCADFPSAAACVAAFLAAAQALPRHAVLAVAGPVQAGTAHLTNNAWHLSEPELAAALGFAHVSLMNDFAALAVATARLAASDHVAIGMPSTGGPTGGTIAIMGPGTGFGLAALAGGTQAGLLVTEGGHIAFAPTDRLEVEILAILSRRHGRVSIERVLSGPGMAELHAALAEIHGASRPRYLEPPAIIAGADAGDPACQATVDRYCAILGATAGDLALALGARGGVFIGGGIAPRLLGPLASGSFRARFEAKGRFTAYMQAIPTSVIVCATAALRGAAEELHRLRTPGAGEAAA